MKNLLIGAALGAVITKYWGRKPSRVEATLLKNAAKRLNDIADKLEKVQ